MLSHVRDADHCTVSYLSKRLGQAHGAGEAKLQSPPQSHKRYGIVWSASGNLEGIQHSAGFSLHAHESTQGAATTNYDDHERLLPRTTSYELRRTRNTITTKYDYDDSSRGLASIGFLLTLLLLRNSITTNYELRRTRTTITTKYDYDEIRLRRLQ